MATENGFDIPPSSFHPPPMQTPPMNEQAQKAYQKALRRIQACRRKGKEGMVLDLGFLGLTQVPPEIGQLAALTELLLHGNQLTSLPPEIGQLSALRELILNDNQLTILPPEIGQLSALKVLLLSHNQLTKLPPETAQLSSLTRLWLYYNRFRTIPLEILRLSALREISLSGNQLTHLPPQIGEMKKLQKLILEDNSLVGLPESLKGLTQLQTLTLHGNEALGLPLELLGPTYAESLDKNPPAKPQAILDYYFRINVIGTATPLNEFKLIFVGRGGVGKTALVNRLVRDVFTSTDMTRGIHIEPWSVQVGADEVAAHVWDFGGQEIMHGTHQFFLTERSLYVLVLAARESKQNEDAEYWLKTISAFGGKSPVIVVQNKSDERPCEVNENALKKKYPTICAFIQTDCLSGRGIQDLKQAISTQADQLDGVRAAFPAAWKAIKKKLSGMKQNFLTFEEFRQECAALGEPKEDGQVALAGVMHVLGIALNYRDDERLRETSVLNPLWVTGGIYALLNDNELARRHGEMTLADFKRVLSPVDYPVATHEFLKNLMGKFELCFPLKGKELRYLIPELLGEQEPDEAGPLDTNEALAFTYFYPKMLPHGLIPRLIVRLYQIIRGKLRWRTGAVFEWIAAVALVKADADERCVRVRVHGSARRRRELLGIIRQEFDVLHRQFHGLLPREVIQLPDYPVVSVDYSHVEAAARAGMSMMPVFTEGNMIQIDPNKLLREFEIEGEARDAGNRGASEVEPTPPPRQRSKRLKEEGR